MLELIRVLFIGFAAGSLFACVVLTCSMSGARSQGRRWPRKAPN